MRTNVRESFPFPSMKETLEARIRALEKDLTKTNESMDCSYCKGTVNKDLVICPHCLSDLKINCPFCGELIASGSHFCTYCGNRL